MLVLALETSTSQGSAALLDETEVLAEVTMSPGLTHSRTLLPGVEQILADNKMTVTDLDLIAVTIGPGSFTGLRIGLSAAKGLAWSAGKPLVGAPSLDVMVRNLSPSSLQVCPLIDARKNEVYTALYKFTSTGAVERRSEYKVLSPEKLTELITVGTIFFGDGARTWGSFLTESLGALYQRAPEVQDFPRASHLGRLGLALFRQGAESNPASILPLYIRPSEAELSLGRKL